MDLIWLLAEDEDALLTGKTHFFHFSVFAKQHRVVI